MSTKKVWLKDQTSSNFVLDKELGAGGEGSVYTVDGNPDLVAKIYHPNRRTSDVFQKLQLMIQYPPKTVDDITGKLYVAWPESLLYDDTQKPIGFIMPKVEKQNLLFDYYNPSLRKRNAQHVNYANLCSVAMNLAKSLNELHGRGYVVGDINESNAYVVENDHVTLIDSDSFQVKDYQTTPEKIYRCVVGKPEYTPPELQGISFNSTDRTPVHDRFALGVVIYQLLMEGHHPFRGIYKGKGEPPKVEQNIAQGYFLYNSQQIPLKPPPTAIGYQSLHPELRSLFSACFDHGHGDPNTRPDPRQWATALETAIATLRQCGKNRNHWYFGTASSCPWCTHAIDSFPAQYNTAPFTPNTKPVPKKSPVSPNTSPAPQKKPAPLPIQAHTPQVKPMDRKCPKCGSRKARIRRDWYARANALRCLNCNSVFGKMPIKRCPQCGEQNARLRRDWYKRGRAFRCRKCNRVFGGSDLILPQDPVGRTPNVEKFLSDYTKSAMSAAELENRAQGAMLGIVVGNLLGISVEGRSRRRIRQKYPNGITDIDPTEASKPLDDDPAQAVELAEALLAQGNLPEIFAKRLINWRKVNGRGMGRMTRQSIAQLADGVPSPIAAYAVYRAKGYKSPNGGIMRCAPVAIAHRNDPAVLVRDTADSCAVTHYAPESQWSCVIANAAIAVLLSGNKPDITDLLAAAKADGCPNLIAKGKSDGIPIAPMLNAANRKKLPNDMQWMRGNRGPNWHTLLTMQIGLWAAVTSLNFEDALIAIVNEGVDTDTNAALAGAILGARYGIDEIPQRWIQYVPQRKRFTDLANRLIAINP